MKIDIRTIGPLDHLQKALVFQHPYLGLDIPTSNMQQEPSLLDGINSLRSIREFKPDPIPRNTLTRILEAATKAASGSNTQPWEFVVVEDAKVKARLTVPMLEAWMKRLGASSMSKQMRQVYDDATEMLRNTEKVPAIVFCCFDRNKSSKSEEVQYASILPSVQNLMLASRPWSWNMPHSARVHCDPGRA